MKKICIIQYLSELSSNNEKMVSQKIKVQFQFQILYLNVKLPICTISTDITINTPSMYVQDLCLACSLGKCFYI